MTKEKFLGKNNLTTNIFKGPGAFGLCEKGLNFFPKGPFKKQCNVQKNQLVLRRGEIDCKHL